MIKGETRRNSFGKLKPAPPNANAVSMATREPDPRSRTPSSAASFLAGAEDPRCITLGFWARGPSERFPNKGSNLQSVFQSYSSSLQLSSV